MGHHHMGLQYIIIIFCESFINFCLLEFCICLTNYSYIWTLCWGILQFLSGALSYQCTILLKAIDMDAFVCEFIYLFVYRPTNSVGFHQAAKEGSITISLKAILPKAAWYWNESTSQVYIRFGIKQLGDWKYNFGPGKVR